MFRFLGVLYLASPALRAFSFCYFQRFCVFCLVFSFLFCSFVLRSVVSPSLLFRGRLSFRPCCFARFGLSGCRVLRLPLLPLRFSLGRRFCFFPSCFRSGFCRLRLRRGFGRACCPAFCPCVRCGGRLFRWRFRPCGLRRPLRRFLVGFVGFRRAVGLFPFPRLPCGLRPFPLLRRLWLRLVGFGGVCAWLGFAGAGVRPRFARPGVSRSRPRSLALCAGRLAPFRLVVVCCRRSRAFGALAVLVSCFSVSCPPFRATVCGKFF